MRTFHVPSGSMKIACRQSEGPGPSVVLLHGNSCSSRAFARQLNGEPGRRFSLTAIDLPGHGASDDADDPAATYCLPGYARILTDVVQQLGLHRALFVGWSLGGHILLEAARRLPEAAGFMLVATPPLGNPPDFAGAFHAHPTMAFLFRHTWSAAEAAAFATMSFGENPPAVLVQDLHRADGRARECLGASIRPDGYCDELAVAQTLVRPVALVIGEHEPLVRQTYLRSLHLPALWRGDLQIVSGAGHAPQWQTPPAFDALLEAFIADCRPG